MITAEEYANIIVKVYLTAKREALTESPYMLNADLHDLAIKAVKGYARFAVAQLERGIQPE
jgi:hypothetical protein